MNTIAKNSWPAQRPTLGLRGVAPRAIQPPKTPSPVAPAKSAAPAPPADDVPVDALISYCCWYVGRRRPSRRYLNRETALAEARRLCAENPGAVVHTYRLELIAEDAP